MTIKLLVADDSLTIQKVISLAFSDEDVAIEMVSNVYAAVNSARVFMPDIVLADVSVPGGGGYEVCERIKKDPELADIPVIVTVGAFESFDEEEASRVKCNGQLSKPFDTTELIAMVHSLVEQRTESEKEEALLENPATSLLPAQTTKPANIAIGDSRVLDSFLGKDRILDLFDAETLALSETLLDQKTDKTETGPTPAPNDTNSEDFITTVVERIVQQMSSDVIREVAWEVVPELSEILIRRVIEEHNKS